MRTIVMSLFFVACAVAQEPKPDLSRQQPYERMLTGDDGKQAMELEKKIQELETAGKRDEAAREADALLALRARLQGDDHWQVIDARLRLADLRQDRTAEQVRQLGEAGRLDRQVVALYQQGKFREAISLAQGALQIRRDVLGEKHPDIAASLNNLVSLYQYQGESVAAEPLIHEALKIRREVLGEKHPATAMSLDNLAGLYYLQGKFAEAEPLYRDALRIRREVLGEKHVHTTTTMNNLAELYRSQSRYTEAEPLFRDALKICREVQGERHPDTATSLKNLGLLYYSQGRNTEAEPLFRDALRIRRDFLGEKHPDTATSLDALAELYRSQGRYTEAEPLFLESLKIKRQVLGEIHPDTATSLNNLAGLYQSQGKSTEAEPLFRDALKITRDTLGEIHPDTAQSLNNLAGLYQDQGRSAEAEPLFRDALKITREVFGEKHPYSARSLNNLAGIYYSQAKFAEAEPLLREALEICREVLGEKHPNTAKTLINLAGLYQHQGSAAEAEPLLREAIEITREVLGEKHPETALSLKNLAILYLDQGKSAEAEATLLDARRSYEASRLLRGQALERSLESRGQDPYPLLAAVSAGLGKPGEAFLAIELHLGRGLLDEQASRRGVTLSAEDNQRKQQIADRLADIEPRLLTLTTQREHSPAEQTELDKLIEERRHLDDMLADLGSALSRREVADLKSIQSAIPADAAFVTWVDVTNDSGKVQEHWACLVRSQRDPIWVQLPGRGEKQTWTESELRLTSDLRNELGKQSPDSGKINELFSQVRTQRFTPLEQHLVGIKTLYVAPIGQMAGVPVEVLAPQFTVSYIPSGTYLARHKDQPAAATSGLLALGDPIFRTPREEIATPKRTPPTSGVYITTVVPGGAAAQARLLAGDVILRYGTTELKSVDDLMAAVATNATAKEASIVVWRETADKDLERTVPTGKLGVILDQGSAAEAVASRRRMDATLAMRGGNWGELPGTKVEVTGLAKLVPAANVLVNGEASEANIESLRMSGDLEKYRYLHFATHGEGNSDKAFESTLILAQNNLPAELTSQPGEPFLDGKVSAREVLDYWKLNADLVTLSACETANGKSSEGDGLLGFAQAFLTAGSRSVCLSLWKVDDCATSLLMQRFYENLITRKMPKAAALHEAKSWLRNLSAGDAATLAASISNGVSRGDRGPGAKLNKAADAEVELKVPGQDKKPFAEPRYWAAFILIGDPN